MKKLSILIILLVALLTVQEVNAQVLSETAKQKVTVGVDLFTDIWLYDDFDPLLPPSFTFRTINQGVTVFVMYNFQIAQSLNSFSIGLDIRNHNMYSNSVIKDIKADSIIYELITKDYRRSKVNVTYIDLPVELKLRNDKGFKLGVGLKVGYKIGSKEKYVGNRTVPGVPTDNTNVNIKSAKIAQLEDWVFGATLRIGYKWFSAFGYYQFTPIYIQGRGPKLTPISVGITITPF